MERVFIDYSIQKLEQLLSRIRACAERLDGEQIWARGGDNENAIGNLILHLSGNVRQWIVSGVGGAPDARVRDEEFLARGNAGAAELISRIEAAVSDATSVLRSLAPGRLAERVRIQKYDVTVLEAVYHVVEHFAEHSGQIIFATKMLAGEDLGFYSHLKAASHSEKTP